MAKLNPLSLLHWNSFVCGLSGHMIYLPDEPELAQRLQVSTPAGTATRCLRCGAFVPNAAYRTGPADHAPLVRRGRQLEDAFILRFLAVMRFFHFVGFAALAAAVVTFRTRRGDLAAAFYGYLPLLQPVLERLGVDPSNSKTISSLENLLATAPRTLTLVTAGLILYAALELAEAVGLWLMQRWGEYVAAVGTSALVPLEIYELIHKPTPFKVLALVVNLAAVAYLLWTKRLFGLRGGRRAYEEQRNAASLLEIEKAAVGLPSTAAARESVDQVEHGQGDRENHGEDAERPGELRARTADER